LISASGKSRTDSRWFEDMAVRGAEQGPQRSGGCDRRRAAQRPGSRLGRLRPANGWTPTVVQPFLHRSGRRPRRGAGAPAQRGMRPPAGGPAPRFKARTVAPRQRLDPHCRATPPPRFGAPSEARSRGPSVAGDATAGGRPSAPLQGSDGCAPRRVGSPLAWGPALASRGAQVTRTIENLVRKNTAVLIPAFWVVAS
jgi:hypothetical protein